MFIKFAPNILSWRHFSIFPFPQNKYWLHIELNSKCENTHLWNLNRASDCWSATGFRNCTKPPQGIRVDTCSYWYIRLLYIIMVIEKSNAWLLHVIMVLNFFRSQVSPQKASRSLMVLSWHPVVLWEYFFWTIPRTAGALVPTFQIPRPDGSLVLTFSNACWDNSSFILIFFSNMWNQQKSKDHLTIVIYQCWADIKKWLKIGQSFKLDLSRIPPSIPQSHTLLETCLLLVRTGHLKSCLY